MTLQAAVDAVRHLHHVHDTGNGSLDAAEHAAADAVTRAVGHGARHDTIAAIAGVHGLAVARLIHNDDARAQALRRARFLAKHYLGEVRSEVRDEALWWYECGVEKKYIAETFGISRPTLDAWMREKAEAAVSAATVE